MKKLSFLLVLVSLSFSVFSADILVEEFGLSPAYGSIVDAVTAASDGDRIIIKNRTGNIPWVEDITINKSLQFLSYTNDSFFIVQGNWTVTPSSGREVSIIGMLNTSGGISSSSGTGTRTAVNIFDSKFTSGLLDFNGNGLNVNIVGVQLDNGYVSLRYGNVIGCDITYSGNYGIYFGSDGSPSDDVMNIVGNRIDHNNTSTSLYHGIYWQSNSHFFNIRNNFIQASNNGIYIGTSKSSNTSLQTIYNNSIQLTNGSSSTSSFRYGIYLAGVGASSIVEVMNNLVDMSATSTSPYYRGIYCGSTGGQRNVYYNMVDDNAILDSDISGNWTVNSNNIVNTAVSMDGSTGSSSQGVNLGNPAAPFYDLDLTRNDMGCFGGSYTTENFFPLFTGSARVWFVDYPFNIRQGNTLSIQGDSYDR